MSIVAAPSLGSKVGKLELIAEAADGHTAPGWIARPEEADAKLVRLALVPKTAADPDAVRRGADDARKLSGDHAIHVISAEVIETRMAITMEHVEGTSLAALIAAAGAQGLDRAVALRISLDIVDALTEAHAASIVHGELGPHLVQVGLDGKTRIVAPGVARLVGKALAPKTPGDRLAYLAPERVKAAAAGGGAAPDPKADVFSAAVITWEMIAKQRMFAGRLESAVIQKVLTAPVPTLASTGADATDAAEEVLRKALDRDASRRLATAKELAEGLREAFGTDVADHAAVAATVEKLSLAAIEALRAAIAAPRPAQASRGSFPSMDDIATPAPAPAPVPKAIPTVAKAGIVRPAVKAAEAKTPEPPKPAEAKTPEPPKAAEAKTTPEPPKAAEGKAPEPPKAAPKPAKPTAPVIATPAARAALTTMPGDDLVEDVVEVDVALDDGAPKAAATPPPAPVAKAPPGARPVPKPPSPKKVPAKPGSPGAPRHATLLGVAPAADGAAAPVHDGAPGPLRGPLPHAPEAKAETKAETPPETKAEAPAQEKAEEKAESKTAAAPAAGTAAPSETPIETSETPAAARETTPAPVAEAKAEKPAAKEPEKDPPTKVDPDSAGGTGNTGNTPTSGKRNLLQNVGPGDTLGRYELLMPVASGGMATVWAARLSGTAGFQKIVAIKTMLPNMSSDADFEEMFLDEARVAARIRHPNVVEIFDLGEQEDTLYLVMEWVEGDTVGALQKASKGHGGIPLPILLRVASQACAGLHAAHELRDDKGSLVDLVHRDISPANILVSRTGFVKIVDFGVAKSKARMYTTRVGGMLKGKTPYLSPEQLGGKVAIDRRSDIYSFGAVLYVLATGFHPFRGETEAKTIENIALRDPVPPRKIDPNIHPELEAIILRALEKDRDKRFASAADMQRAIEGLVGALADPTTDEDVAGFVRKVLGDALETRAKALREGIAKADARKSQGDTAPASSSSVALAASTEEKADKADKGDKADKVEAAAPAPVKAPDSSSKKVEAPQIAAKTGDDAAPVIALPGAGIDVPVSAEAPPSSQGDTQMSAATEADDFGAKPKRKVGWIVGAVLGAAVIVGLLAIVGGGGDKPKPASSGAVVATEAPVRTATQPATSATATEAPSAAQTATATPEPVASAGPSSTASTTEAAPTTTTQEPVAAASHALGTGKVPTGPTKSTGTRTMTAAPKGTGTKTSTKTPTKFVPKGL